MFGVAGVAAVEVQVEDSAGVTTHPLDSPIGAFVASADGEHPAVVRVLTTDGDVLLAEPFSASN